VSPAVVEDDVPRALREARRDGKLVLVEAWAPWCHTCLSMRNYVLPDPAVAGLRDRVLFAAIDTDRPTNAAFLERYPVDAWPTLFVLDPQNEKLLGHWQGSASPAELRELLVGALDQRAAVLDPAGPFGALLEAESAAAKGEHAAAAAAYALALARSDARWPRRSEALAGLIAAAHDRERWTECAELGSEHLPAITGSSLPADTAYLVLDCASHDLDDGSRSRARDAAIARLRQHTAAPPPGASADDQADALATLADALRDQGDAEEARRLTETRLALLERAAREATTVERAATFDYGRMGAYLELGRGEEAVAMLRQRIAELPDSYEPRARLAEALEKLGRDAEALRAVEGALERAYGPRRLRYERLRATLLGKLGRVPEQRAALEAVLEGYQSLPSAVRRTLRQRELEHALRTELDRLLAPLRE
jgi:thioredoxin-like negative regulator of GroEL